MLSAEYNGTRGARRLIRGDRCIGDRRTRGRWRSRSFLPGELEFALSWGEFAAEFQRRRARQRRSSRCAGRWSENERGDQGPMRFPARGRCHYVALVSEIAAADCPASVSGGGPVPAQPGGVVVRTVRSRSPLVVRVNATLVVKQQPTEDEADAGVARPTPVPPMSVTRGLSR